MDLVSINPSDTLRFDYTPAQESHATIELLNPSSVLVNYKIKVTHAAAYKIQSAQGDLLPNATAVVHITLKPSSSIGEEPHKFMVEFTDKADPANKVSKKLSVSFVKVVESADLEFDRLKNEYEKLTSKSAEVTTETDNLQAAYNQLLKRRKAGEDDVLIKKPTAEAFTYRTLILCFILGLFIGTFSSR
jgi:hypothetical protein